MRCRGEAGLRPGPGEAAALRALLQRSHGAAALRDGGDDDAAGVVNFRAYVYIVYKNI